MLSVFLRVENFLYLPDIIAHPPHFKKPDYLENYYCEADNEAQTYR